GSIREGQNLDSNGIRGVLQHGGYAELLCGCHASSRRRSRLCQCLVVLAHTARSLRPLGASMLGWPRRPEALQYLFDEIDGSELQGAPRLFVEFRRGAAVDPPNRSASELRGISCLPSLLQYGSQFDSVPALLGRERLPCWRCERLQN